MPVGVRWAVSAQFEPASLYEDFNHPWAGASSEAVGRVGIGLLLSSGSTVGGVVRLWLLYERIELGLSQAELARGVGMTQPQISNIEGGDSVPALPLLTRLAKALDASLTIDLDGDRSAFVFTAHGRGEPGDAEQGGRSSVA